VLEGLEKEAREARKGLWVDPTPVPPWVYRQVKRGQSLDLSDLAPFDTEIKGSHILAVARSLMSFLEDSPFDHVFPIQ